MDGSKKTPGGRREPATIPGIMLSQHDFYDQRVRSDDVVSYYAADDDGSCAGSPPNYS